MIAACAPGVCVVATRDAPWPAAHRRIRQKAEKLTNLQNNELNRTKKAMAHGARPASVRAPLPFVPSRRGTQANDATDSPT